MKIDSDLRAAIRSAEKAQPSTDWQLRNQQEKDAIAAFLKAKPEIAKRIAFLYKKRETAQKVIEAANTELCKEYGLRFEYNKPGVLEFASCNNASERFTKAGGKFPKKDATRWKFDAVMKELAAADEKTGKAILKRIGINWG